jgi:hypothetical protein
VNVNYGKTAAVLLLATVSSSCALMRNHDVESCASFATRADAPFDSTTARTLAGHYRLVMISESADEYSKSVSGPLDLQPTDAAHETATTPNQAGTLARFDRLLLWGSATLPAGRITIPWNYDPSSTDPNRPGVVVHSSGDIDLGGRRADGEPSVSMHIQSVARDGFGGTWTGVPSQPLPVDPQGKPAPAPHGRFCAFRR